MLKLNMAASVLAAITVNVITTLSVANANVPAHPSSGTLQMISNTDSKTVAAEPTPAIGWLNWERFNKIYVDQLAKTSVSDEQRLAIVKRAGDALNKHLMVLTPDQLHRVVSTFDKEEARLEALLELAASTRYNSSDIPKITSAFKELKNDAHGVLFAIGGYGGY